MRHTSFMTLKCKNQRQKKTFVQSNFMVLHTQRCKIYSLKGKERKPLLLKQMQRWHFTQPIMSLWVTSNLSTLYFKLMTFPIHPVGRLAQDHGSFPSIRACNNTFLTRYRVNQFYKMSCSLNCSIEISRMHWHFENWDDMKHEPRNFGQQKLFC